MWCTKDCLNCNDSSCEFYMTRNEKIQTQYLRMILDLGYDYDGCNTVESLKSLIDELMRLARLGIDINDYEPIYENNGKKFNILGEEIKNEE